MTIGLNNFRNRIIGDMQGFGGYTIILGEGYSTNFDFLRNPISSPDSDGNYATFLTNEIIDNIINSIKTGILSVGNEKPFIYYDIDILDEPDFPEDIRRIRLSILDLQKKLSIESGDLITALVEGGGVRHQFYFHSPNIDESLLDKL